MQPFLLEKEGEILRIFLKMFRVPREAVHGIPRKIISYILSVSEEKEPALRLHLLVYAPKHTDFKA
jgi:hypothetical protein